MKQQFNLKKPGKIAAVLIAVIIGLATASMPDHSGKSIKLIYQTLSPGIFTTENLISNSLIKKTDLPRPTPHPACLA